jgi:hypothetical protein
MKKYNVTWIKMINCEAEIYAKTEQEAIEIAQTTSLRHEVEETFLECDYYEAKEAEAP